MDNFILAADRSDIGSVKMDVGGGRRHGAIAGALLVVAVRGERVIFIPAILSLTLVAEAAGRAFWK